MSVFAHLYLLLYYLLLQVAPLLRRGLKAVARSDRVLDRVRERALLVRELHRMYPRLLRQKVRAEAFDNGSAFLFVGGVLLDDLESIKKWTRRRTGGE